MTELEQPTDFQNSQVQDMQKQAYEIQNEMDKLDLEWRMQADFYSEKAKDTASHIAQLRNEKSLEDMPTDADNMKQKLDRKLESLESAPSLPTKISNLDGGIEVEDTNGAQLNDEENVYFKRLIERLNKQTNELHEKLHSVQAENESLKSSINTMRDKNVTLMTEVEFLKKENTNLEENGITTKDDNRSALSKRVKELDSENLTLKRALKKAEAQLSQSADKISSHIYSGGSVLQTWKQLEDLRKVHDETKERLTECQVSNTEIEKENRRLTKEHALAQANLRTEIKVCKEERIKEINAITTKHQKTVQELQLQITKLENNQNTPKNINRGAFDGPEIVELLETKVSSLEKHVTNLQQKLNVSEEEKNALNLKIAQENGKADMVDQVTEQDKVKIKWLEAQIAQLSVRTEFETKKIEDEKQIIINDLENKHIEKDETIMSLRSELDQLRIEKAKSSVESLKHFEENKVGTEENKKMIDNLKVEMEKKDDEITSLKQICGDQKVDLISLRDEFLKAKSSVGKVYKEHEKQLKKKNELLSDLESKVREQEIVIFGLKNSSEDQNEKLENARLEIDVLKRQREDHLSAIEELQFRTRQEGFQSNQHNQDIEELRKRNEAFELEILAYKEKIVHMEDSMKEIETLKSKTSIQESEIDSLKEVLEKRETLIERMQSSLMLLKETDCDEDEMWKNQINDIRNESRKNEDKLRDELANRENEKNKVIEDLHTKLKDRETTIAALVKASVTIEEKIVVMETDNARMKKYIEDEKNEPSAQVIKLHHEIESLKNKNETLRDQIIVMQTEPSFNEGEMDKYSINNNNAKETWKKEKEMWTEEKKKLIEENKSQLNEKDGAIESLKHDIDVLLKENKGKVRQKELELASLKKYSATQEETIIALQEEIQILEEEKDNSNLMADPEEIVRLKKESELYAGQFIEQEEEIKKLKHLLKKVESVKFKKNASPRSNALERENKDLHKKLEIAESERIEKDKLLEDMEKDIFNLQERLDESAEDGENRVHHLKDELEELRKYVDECEHRLSESSQYYLATIEDLEEQLQVSSNKPNVSDGRMLLEYKNTVKERERTITSLERNANLQGKKISSLMEELDEVRRSIGKRPNQTIDRNLKNNDSLWNEIKTERATNIAHANQIKALKEEISQQHEDIAREARENSELQEKLRQHTEKEKQFSTVTTQNRSMKRDLEIKANLNAELEEKVTELNQTIRVLERKSNRTTSLDSNNVKRTNELLREIEIQQKHTNELMQEIEIEKDQNASLQQEVLELREQSNMASTNNIRIESIERDIAYERSTNEKLKNEITALNSKMRLMEQDLRKSKEQVRINGNADMDKATNIALNKALAESRERATYLESELNKITSIEDSNKIANDNLIAGIEKERSEKEALYGDLEKSKARISELERGARRILELQSDLSEKNIFADGKIHEEFGKIISDLQLKKDGEINSLRKDLADAKQTSLGVESELRNKVEEFENSLKRSKEEYENKMQHKNREIATQKEAIESQEQTMNYMRAEMDQLQNSMEKVAQERRADIEEMQQEFMDTQSKSTKQEREILALKMKLEDSKLKHKGELAKLEGKIALLEEETPLQRSIQTQRDDYRVEELKKEIQQLKWRNTNLVGECETLTAKLSNFEGSQKPSKNDKWRNTALREQVKALTVRIKELEENASVQESRLTVYTGSEQSMTSSRGGGSTMTKYTF